MQDKRKAVLVAAMTTSFITTFMSSALNLSIPAIEVSFAVNATTVNWIVTAYTMMIAGMSLPIGKIADTISHRRVFLLGIAGFGVVSVASVFATSIWFLIALRAVQGVFAAMMFATNNAILVRAFPHEVQGKVLGLSVAATYTGLTAGPVLGGFLNSMIGWKAIFIATALVAAVAFVLSVKFVPRNELSRKPSGQGGDFLGALFYTAAVLVSLYGMTNLTASEDGRIMFAAGIALIIFFFMHEKRSENPIMEVAMFRNKTFTFSNLAALLNYAATFAISYNLSIYLQVVKGDSSARAGLILIAMPVVQAAFSPLMGSLSDRVRPSILASAGMGLCALALINLARISEDSGIAMIMLSLLVAGMGFAMFSSPNTNAIMECVSPEKYGITNSIITTMRTYGQSSGMAVMNIITGMVLGRGSLEKAVTSDVVDMMQTAFVVFAIVCVVGVFFSLARTKLPHRDER